MQIQPMVLKLYGFKQKFTINTINLNGQGGKKKYFFFLNTFFPIDSKILISKA